MHLENQRPLGASHVPGGLHSKDSLLDYCLGQSPWNRQECSGSPARQPSPLRCDPYGAMGLTLFEGVVHINLQTDLQTDLELLLVVVPVILITYTALRRVLRYKQKDAKLANYAAGEVFSMTTLENILVKESCLNKEIKTLESLEAQAHLLRSKINADLESAFQSDSSAAEAADSKTQIQCLVNRISEFTENRQFYQLFQAAEEAVSRIEEHQKWFSAESLGHEIFEHIREGLHKHKASLQVMKDALAVFNKSEGLNGFSSTRDWQEWAEHLERFGEELEDNLPFFSSDEFSKIEAFCEALVLQSRKKSPLKGKTHENRKEEWRRRLRYAAGFILNLMEIAEENALAEEEEIRQDFLLASQLAFKEVWG